MYRPRSIVRLILIGFTVVLAPLMAAVVTAIVQVDRLAQDNRAALIEAAGATQQSRSLVEQLTEMQRALTNFQIRGDADFYASYLDRRRAFSRAADDLSELNLTELGRQALSRLREQEKQLFDRLHDRENEPIAEQSVLPQWTELSNRARTVLSESGRLIEDQIEYTSGTASDVQRTLLLQAAAVIPATLILAAVFVVLITRPMREVGRAIRRLGGREFTEPIEVHGPRDVEEIGRQLDWLRVRIQELEHQKITFLRHISHELKTPLTTIREGAELLFESLSDRSPEESEIARIMRSNSLHLQKLIEDLLRFGKTLEIVTDLRLSESLKLREIVQSVIETQALASSAKSMEIVPILSPVHVRGDENKIRTVIDNLLANAIKYTPPGGRIRISLEQRGENAVIDVEDSGPGVADAEKYKIFEPFQQGQARYESSVQGTGLGLAIAREYVEAHDGIIEVISSAEGAHFRVVLPLAGPKRST